MISIGDVINDSYKITGQIGEGGGGIVYKARHIRLDTDVVVKQIREEVKDKIYRRQEADILKQLKHPYLPRVYDFIEDDEGIFTVMDFIEGTALDKIIDNNASVSQKDIIKWGRQLSDALSYLHGQNPPIIHSDIKPANIIITPEGDATLIDFNVSVLFDDTEKYSVGISLGYAPPEQYRDLETYKKVTHVTTIPGSNTDRVFSMITGISGNQNIEKDYEKTVYLMADDDATVIFDDEKTAVIKKTMSIDARSDVYSLGCVLYHLATGKAPSLDFNAIQPLGSQNISLSEGLKIIIDKMMELAPSDRYQSGGEVFEAYLNIVSLDKRYIASKKKEKTFLLLSIVFAIIGAALVGLGIKRIQIENDAYYDGQILAADEYANNFDYNSANQIVAKLQSKDPERLAAFEREAYYLYLAGRYEEAQDLIEEIFASQVVVENQYNTADVIGDLYAIMGNCAYELEDYANARAYIEQALEYVEDNPTYYRDYAISLAKSGELEKAEKAVEAAKTYGMNEVSMNYVDAEIESVKGNYQDALELLVPIINNKSNIEIYNRALLLAARDYLSLEQYENALKIYQDIYDSGVDTYQIGENIAYLYAEMGDLKTAEEKLLELMERFPNNYRVYKRLSVLEVLKQEEKENIDRDYHQMQEYYDKAFELYEQSNVEDSEMDVLKAQMQNVVDGGWL